MKGIFFMGRLDMDLQKSLGWGACLILAMVRWDMKRCSGGKRGLRDSSIVFCRFLIC